MTLISSPNALGMWFSPSNLLALRMCFCTVTAICERFRTDAVAFLRRGILHDHCEPCASKANSRVVWHGNPVLSFVVSIEDRLNDVV